MTRNPETTEAARAALLARLSRILGEVPVGTLDLLNVLTGPDCASYTAAVLAVSPAVTEREDDEALAAQLTERAADLERPLIESRTLVAAALVLRGVHENSTQNMGADFATSPAVTEGERADSEAPGSLDPSRGRKAPSQNIGPGSALADQSTAPSPAVTATEDETWGREKPHTLTRYGTTNCPVEGVRANVDDGECSACGDPVVAAVPADPNSED